jgi:hypothetical protein
MSTLVWVVALSCVVAAAAQSGEPPATGPVGLVLPVPNAPFSAQQVEERTRTAPDGTLTTKVIASQVYRDSAGRTRIEWRALDAPRGAYDVVYLIDPVSWSATILLVGPKVASQNTVPRSSPGGFQVGLPAVGERLPATEWQTKAESLGTKIVEGIEVRGTRTTQTAEGKPPLTAVWETWSSQALGLKLIVEASGPDWKHTAKLRNLDRNEPDPSLFVIPPDYTVQD